MKKKVCKIPYILAIIRAFAFFPIILSTFNVILLPFISQLLLVAVVMISDKFDGEISRKYNNEKEQLKFRLCDTIIDKLGIGSCLIGLMTSGKMPVAYFSTLLAYNVILIGAGTINLLLSNDKKESTVQGLFTSRLFVALTGLSLLLFNTTDVNKIIEIVMTTIMALLGVISLGNQAYDKIVKDKYQNDDLLKDISNNSESNKNFWRSQKMNKINVAKGLVASQMYIKKLDKNIENVYDNTVISSSKEMEDLKKYQESFISNISGRFVNFESHIVSAELQKEAYLKIMKGDSRRFRPLLLFLGNLCGSECVKKETLVSSGLSIEMIHKMSLILDDYFDKDLMRRGNPTFHTIYDEKVILDSTKLLLDLSNTILMNSISVFPTEKKEEILKLYKEIIIDMGTGFIEDLDRKEKAIDLVTAYKLNDLQSTTILRNSLLIGYTLSNKTNVKDETYYNLYQIGASIGKTFQGFNDVENFLSEDTQTNNKGNLYSDLQANRKNIILGKVPKELFCFPYTNEDIIEYIKVNRLMESTVEELVSGISVVKKNIIKLPSKVARDTLLYATDKAIGKSLIKVRNNFSN